MDFWNTVLGQRLAETLNYCLPKLVKKKSNTPFGVVMKISKKELKQN